MNAVIRLRNGI